MQCKVGFSQLFLSSLMATSFYQYHSHNLKFRIYKTFKVSLYDMSVKRSFDTHLIPGLLRSYAAPAILQIFEIR